MKNKNSTRNKVLAGLGIVVICALAAFGMCESYKIIKKTAVDKNYNYFETDEFQTSLIESCYGLAYGMKTEGEENQNKEPSDFFCADKVEREEESFNEYRYFDDTIRHWNRRLMSYNENMKYYASQDGKILENEDALKEQAIDAGKYQFFVRMNFDNTGILSIGGLKGAEKIDFKKLGYVNLISDHQPDRFRPIKNMEVVFAVPTELSGEDRITEGLRDQGIIKYRMSTCVAVLAWIGLILVIALLFPYSVVKDFAVLRIPFALWCIAVWLTILGVYMLCGYGVGESITHNSVMVGEFLVTHTMIMSVNFLLWFVAFIVLFLAVMEIKSIFIIGVKEFFKQRTILGRVIHYGVKFVRETVSYVEHIDLRAKNNKYIWKLLAINAVILFVITCVWFAGIPFIIVYTIVLYVVIKKYVDIISANYRTLTEATNQIAEGNLDVTIEEDLGVFNPFKDNLEKIQGGFRKAVEEEVKSQKMKTDLISNVSHDLKTPLTAIVTYTDLLQDVSLPEEKRKEYLEVLDRKAQRLQVLIEDLFEMSKVSSGTVHLDLEEVDVVSLMRQTIIEVEDQLENAGLTVKTTFSSERIMKQLDSERMYRVFENLLLNTSKYAMKNTRVFIDIIEQEDHVTITVKNISAEEITFNEQEIVERFIRGDKSRNTEGSGLGLAIAKSFVELQGGKFHIEIDGDMFKAIITL